LQTILLKETLRFLRIWIQTILPPAITTALYFIIFGKLIGAQLGPVDGLSYTQYIAPGLIMMAVITNAYSNVVSSFFKRQIPAPHRGNAGFAPARRHHRAGLRRWRGGAGLAVGIVVTAISLFFADLHWQHPCLSSG